MKALTLTQPWATLVAIGAKRIETRSWSTKYRGPMAIHAARGGFDDMLTEREPFYSALVRGGIQDLREIPLGAVVATCELVDVVRTGQLGAVGPDQGGWIRIWDGRYAVPDSERPFGDFSAGRFAWLLADVKRVDPPIPAKGRLALWTWNEKEVIDGDAERSVGASQTSRVGNREAPAGDLGWPVGPT